MELTPMILSASQLASPWPVAQCKSMRPHRNARKGPSQRKKREKKKMSYTPSITFDTKTKEKLNHLGCYKIKE